MTPAITLTVARIGNSRGVRLPAATLARYLIGDSVIMEERDDGILLRPVSSKQLRLSWAETARAMAAECEDWSDWDATSADGLEQIAWDVAPPKASRAAESASSYDVAKRSTKGTAPSKPNRRTP